MKRLLVTLLAASLSAGMLGCGGDSNDKSGGTTTSGTTTSGSKTTTGETTTTGGGGEQKGAKSVVKVNLVDVALQPANPTVKTGTVTFRLKNQGTLLHAVKVEGPGGTKSSKPLLPGKSAVLKVTFNKPGKYDWYCPIDTHRKLGMKGKITVRGGA